MSEVLLCMCRGTSLIRNSTPLGTYSMAMPRALVLGKGGCFFRARYPCKDGANGFSNVALYRGTSPTRNSGPLGPGSGTKHRALW